MSVKIVYGELNGHFVNTSEQNYKLNHKSEWPYPMKGWFKLKQDGNNWRICKKMFQLMADSYLDENGKVVTRN